MRYYITTLWKTRGFALNRPRIIVSGWFLDDFTGTSKAENSFRPILFSRRCIYWRIKLLAGFRFWPPHTRCVPLGTGTVCVGRVRRRKTKTKLDRFVEWGKRCYRPSICTAVRNSSFVSRSQVSDRSPNDGAGYLFSSPITIHTRVHRLFWQPFGCRRRVQRLPAGREISTTVVVARARERQHCRSSSLIS